MKRLKTYFNSAGRALSKCENWFSPFIFLCFTLGAAVFNSFGQDIEVIIKMKPHSNLVHIDGRFLRAERFESKKNFSFSADDSDPGNKKVSEFQVNDFEGKSISVRELIPGEYLAASDAVRWKYTIDIGENDDFTKKAHKSWMSNDFGVLMPDDMLPDLRLADGEMLSARVKIQLPTEWTINGSVPVNFERSEVLFLISGEWRFNDGDAVKAAKEIISGYKELFGEFPVERALLVLTPVKNRFGRWEAETRGNVISIVSGDMPFQKQSLQRLHEQLRHEIFHLWIPNKLALRGNYDWFYEGFAVYQALRTGISMNRISFADFLQTLSQAMFLAERSDSKSSLIEVSNAARSGNNHSVYAKGMLIAFLCDSAMLNKSRGKRSIADVLQRIYQNHRLPNLEQDGNISILKILETYKELQPIVANYITGSETIEWKESLDYLGLELTGSGNNLSLAVKQKLNKRQKDLLNELGYNNWRKIR